MQPTNRHRDAEFGVYRVICEVPPGANVPGESGRALHAALLDLVSQFDRALAERLHGSAMNSWTIGPLRPFETAPPTGIRTSRRFAFHCSTLDAWTTSVLEAAYRFALRERASVRIGSTELSIIDIIAPPLPVRGSGLARTYRDLARLSLPRDIVELYFLSPTLFLHGKHALLDPQPRLVFQSYRKRWDSFSRVPLVELDDLSLQRGIQLLDSRISVSRRVRTWDARGFTGWAHYSIAGSDAFRQQISTLAVYACLCGTGAKTAFGMGDTIIGR